MPSNLSPGEKERLKQIDDFFSKFEENNKRRNTNAEDFLAQMDAQERRQRSERAELDERRKTRMQRLQERKGTIGSQVAMTPSSKDGNTKKQKPKRKNAAAYLKESYLRFFRLG